MASETLDEAKSPDDGSPVDEAAESTDRVEAAAAGGEESKESEVAAGGGDGKVEEKRKRGWKRKATGAAEKEGTEKKERKRRSVSREAASPVERPSRERKTVERLIQQSPRKVPASKVLSIEQGPGTMLKDIPNVSFKLSKRKSDENLQVLHTILFGKKSNAHFLKRNITQFSGFVWAGNEEKQRSRVKEKLDKCTKDRLLDFSELLDIQIARATTKKEEITVKLLEFLESPHATRDVVLSEKKKGKRKRRTKGIGQTVTGGASSESELKKHKSSLDTEVKKRRRRHAKAKKEDKDEGGLAEKEDEDEHGSTEEDVDEDGSIDNEDTSNAEKDNGDTEEESVRAEKEDEGDEPEEPMASTKGSDEKQKKDAEPKIKEKASPVKNAFPAKSDKSLLKPVSKKAFSATKDVPNAPVPSRKGSLKGQSSRISKANTLEKAVPINKGSLKPPKNISKSSPRKSTVDETESGLPSSSKPKKDNKRKGQSKNPVPKDNKAVKKQATKSASKPTKEPGKGLSSGDANVGPSTEELHSVVSNILKEVDFHTATLADILKQVGAHFNTNLMDRKAEVKQIITDVINNMTDDEDGADDEDGDGGEDGKEESDEDGAVDVPGK